MKCQYIGWYTRVGCNEDALEGGKFCHAHREQGASNEMFRKIGCGCFAAALLLTLAITCIAVFAE